MSIEPLHLETVLAAPAAQALADPPRPTVELEGIAFDALTEEQTVAHVLRCVDAGTRGFVVTLNLDFLRRVTRDADFAATCGRATLRVADGHPLVWASRISGTPLPERVAGSDLIVSLSGAAARRGASVFLLGGRPGAAERCAAELRRRFPDLVVAGTYCPPFGFERDSVQLEAIRSAITEAAPSIVYVGLGSPKQEALIERLLWETPEAQWLGIGASIDFLAGDVPRAPSWMQRSGLEWLHRLLHEPQRLARRYLVEGLPFFVGLLVRSYRRGLGQPAPRVVSPDPAPTVDAAATRASVVDARERFTEVRSA